MRGQISHNNTQSVLRQTGIPLSESSNPNPVPHEQLRGLRGFRGTDVTYGIRQQSSHSEGVSGCQPEQQHFVVSTRQSIEFGAPGLQKEEVSGQHPFSQYDLARADFSHRGGAKNLSELISSDARDKVGVL